jgi:hypothetical protein
VPYYTATAGLILGWSSLALARRTSSSLLAIRLAVRRRSRPRWFGWTLVDGATCRSADNPAMAKGEVEEEGDGTEGGGEIWRASVVQELSGVLCACGVESESAAIAHGLAGNLRLKIFESDLRVSWSVWCQEKGRRGTSGVGVGRKGSIITRCVYAYRPVYTCLAR